MMFKTKRLTDLTAERDRLTDELSALDQQRSAHRDALTAAQVSAERERTPDAQHAADRAEQHDLDLHRQQQRKRAAIQAIAADIAETEEQQAAAQRQAKLDRVKAIRKEAIKLADELDRKLHDATRPHEIMIALDNLRREAVPVWRELYGEGVELQGHEFYGETWAAPGQALGARLTSINRLALGKSDPRKANPFATPHYLTMRAALRLE